MDILNYILTKILIIPAAVFAFSFAPFGKALVSDKLGDPTPRNNDRLTMNPLAHLDVLGFICIILFSIGWTKPIPTNSSFYKKPTRDKALVTLSGPIFLLGAGIVFSIISTFFNNSFLVWFPNNIVTVIAEILSYFVTLPILLANFWMIPLPGLDGYDFVTIFTPYSWNEKLFKIERYSMLIFIAFILLIDFSDTLRGIVFAPADLIINGVFFVGNSFWGLIF